MRPSREPMTLTRSHIDRVHRNVTDSGPVPGVAQQTDADYAEWVDRIAGSHPAPDGPLRLFAAGSLIWKPEIDHTAEQPATLRGWHRAFCLQAHRFRGTPDRPGLMMAIDRGGTCRGVVFDLPREPLAPQLDRLFRREFTVKPINNMPRWLLVQTDAGPVWALGFVMNRASPYYAGHLPPEDVARTLARACGHWGSGAEYLFNTVSHLDSWGIRDRGLWRLQRLVAAEIDAMAS